MRANPSTLLYPMATRSFIHPQNLLRNLKTDEVEQGLREAGLPDNAVYIGLTLLDEATLDTTLAQLITAARDFYFAEINGTY